jgi:hypothetical protein
MTQTRSLMERPMRRIITSCLLTLSLLAGTAGYAQTPTHTPAPSMTCPGEKVVWVNTKSHVYHYEGERYFGSTQQGKIHLRKCRVA